MAPVLDASQTANDIFFLCNTPQEQRREFFPETVGMYSAIEEWFQTVDYYQKRRLPTNRDRVVEDLQKRLDKALDGPVVRKPSKSIRMQNRLSAMNKHSENQGLKPPKQTHYGGSDASSPSHSGLLTPKWGPPSNGGKEKEDETEVLLETESRDQDIREVDATPRVVIFYGILSLLIIVILRRMLAY